MIPCTTSSASAVRITATSPIPAFICFRLILKMHQPRFRLFLKIAILREALDCIVVTRAQVIGLAFHVIRPKTVGYPAKIDGTPVAVVPATVLAVRKLFSLGDARRYNSTLFQEEVALRVRVYLVLGIVCFAALDIPRGSAALCFSAIRFFPIVRTFAVELGHSLALASQNHLSARHNLPERSKRVVRLAQGLLLIAHSDLKDAYAVEEPPPLL